jgi:hypothetical protein
MTRKKLRNDLSGVAKIAAILVMVAIIILAGLGAAYFMYNQEKYPGCEYADGVSDSTVAGVIDITLVAVRSYNYMGGVNALGLSMQGAFDQIERSEMSNYATSFWDWIGNALGGEAIETASTGHYVFEVQKGGDVVFSAEGDMRFVDYPEGGLSDTIGQATLPTVFVGHGTYIIYYSVTLGGLSKAISTTWVC